MKTIFHSTLLAGAFLVSDPLDAQALLVASQNGSTQSYTLTDIAHIVFHNNNLEVQEIDCEKHHFSVFFTDYMTLDGTIGTDPLMTSELLLYPNPASSIIQIVGPAAMNAWIHIYNAFGQLVSKQYSPSSAANLDVQTLATGVYVVEIDGQTFQFVKQ
jgi:Secretion system C-terminal sorting domain